ncbi:MAG TPA: MOSC domain-containing protein [Trebonia sp.]
MRDEETERRTTPTARTADDALGTVAVLRRYPVKSMLGEDLHDGQVTRRGLTGDRVLALIHRETGKVASAKNPRLWRGLLKLAAATSGSAVKITLPDATVISSTAPGLDAVLSGLLGQPVTLTDSPPPGAALDRADPEQVLRDGIDAQVQVEVLQSGAASPEGTFFDFAPLHLITTSTLDRIAGLSPRGTVEPVRYRPNIVVRAAAPGFAENDWTGRDLRVGRDLVLRIVSRTPRCAIPTLEHGDLPRDTDALRTVAVSNRIRPVDSLGPQPCAGVYAQVLRPGRIQVGDSVSLA